MNEAYEETASVENSEPLFLNSSACILLNVLQPHMMRTIFKYQKQGYLELLKPHKLLNLLNLSCFVIQF